MRDWIFTVQELASGDMTAANARGSALPTTYALEPRVWLKDILDAAKKRQQFVQFAYSVDVPQGSKDVVIPRRKEWIASGTTWAGSVTPGSSVNYTKIDVIDGQVLTPSEKNAGVAVTYDTIRTNLVDYVAEAKNQLIYYAGDDVDKAIAAKVVSGVAATSTAAGYQTIYGGDATQSSEIAEGDIINTDMMAEGKRKLRSTTCKYWTLGTGESTSSAAKNPWQNTPDAPFVLVIAPEQEETFLKDSQFVNASEYGSDRVIHNGEIGDYLGVRIVVSNNTHAVAAGSTAPDGTTASVALHCCPMFKAKRAYAIAWGLRPRLHVFDYPRELERDIILEQAYDTQVVHHDAIVVVTVADE